MRLSRAVSLRDEYVNSSLSCGCMMLALWLTPLCCAPRLLSLSVAWKNLYLGEIFCCFCLLCCCCCFLPCVLFSIVVLLWSRVVFCLLFCLVFVTCSCSYMSLPCPCPILRRCCCCCCCYIVVVVVLVFFPRDCHSPPRNTHVAKSGAGGGPASVQVRVRGRRAQPLLLSLRGLRWDYLAQRYAPLQLR